MKVNSCGQRLGLGKILEGTIGIYRDLGGSRMSAAVNHSVIGRITAELFRTMGREGLV